MRIFRRRKVNFQSKNLVICVMGLLSKETCYDQSAILFQRYFTWTSKQLPEMRILIRGRNGKFYEPDGSKKYYTDRNAGKRAVKHGDLIVMSCSAPIQYKRIFEFTKEEKRTKAITIERINELEDLLNNKTEDENSFIET